MEFIIADVEWPETKWGHVSLRVVNNEKDFVFDFGRYGAMWGFFNTEGAPILRVWKNSAQAHLNYLKKGGGAVTEIRFEASEEQADNVMKFFDEMIKGRKPYSTSLRTDYYDTKAPNFHSITHNCTTVAIAAFLKGFPDYNVNNTSYAKAVDLAGIFRVAAQRHAYNSKRSQWQHVWWPMDLKVLLETEFVGKKIADQKKYQTKTVKKVERSNSSTESGYY